MGSFQLIFTTDFCALNWGWCRFRYGYTAEWTYFIASSSLLMCSLTGADATMAPTMSIGVLLGKFGLEWYTTIYYCLLSICVFDSYLLTLNQLTIKRSGTCFICFQIMSDWEVSDHLHLSLNKFGYLIPGSNCLWGMWVVFVCMEGGRRYPYDTGRRKCI